MQNKIYTDLYLCDKNENYIEYKGIISQNELLNKEWKADDISIAWEFCGHPDNQPDFKYHNDAFYELLEPAGFEKFVNESMETIDELMGG